MVIFVLLALHFPSKIPRTLYQARRGFSSAAGFAPLNDPSALAGSEDRTFQFACQQRIQ
jgi:hypothetical protein